MVLSPQDIHNKEFSIKMRGYNIDQVNDFLDQIIKDYQITIKQNDDLRTALNDTQSKLKHFNNLQNSLNQSILVAQQAADQVKNKADGEADEIIAKANQRAQSVINDADQKAQITLYNANQRANEIISQSTKQVNGLSSEMESLKKSTQLFRQKVTALLKGQLEFTQSSDWDNLLSSESTPTVSTDGANDGLSTDKFVHNLDNSQINSVKSSQDSGNQILSNGQSSTVVYYPDGSNKQI
ncbi:DivIVA domain-containing protein [Nicoliella lavandulae]|uniref:DivIVA domain-containing protein n=1 Tax=Nicoliella lavandulae TaxID=3082954 RepID=A0ABU8SLK4_9LACO